MGASKRLFEDLNQRFNSYNVGTKYEYEYEFNFSQREISFSLSEQNTNNQQYKLLKN